MKNQNKSDNTARIIASLGDSFVFNTISGGPITDKTVRNLALRVNQVGKENSNVDKSSTKKKLVV